MRLRILPIVLIAGCLPGRSNESDRVNRPRAVMQILDRGVPAEDGTCPDDGGIVTQVAPRAHCLVLDPAGTSDPNDDTMTLTWLVPGVPPIAGALDTPLLLDPGIREGLALDTSLTIALVARSHHGVESRAEKTLVLTNDAPVIDDAIPQALTYPRHGLAWAPDQPIPVTFEAPATSDPDGDRLRFCWTFPGEDESCALATPQVTRDVTPSNVPYRVLFRVKDTDGEPGDSRTKASIRIAYTVRFGDSGSWAADGTGRIYRVAPDVPRTILSSLNSDPILATLVPPRGTGDARILAYHRDPSTFDPELVSIATRDHADAKVGPALDRPSRIAADVTGFVAGVSLDEPTYAFNVETWQLDTAGLPVFGTLALTPDATPLPMPTPAFAYSEVQMAVAGDKIWMTAARVPGAALPEGLSHAPPGDLWRGPPLPFAVVATSGAGSFLDLSVRPDGSLETWTLHDTGTALLLEVFDASGIRSGDAVALDIDARAIAWIGPDDFWLIAPGDLRRVSAPALARGEGLSAATIDTVVGVPACRPRIVDDVTGRLWCGGAGETTSISVSGDIDVFEGGAVPQLVDPLGSLFVTRFDQSFFQFQFRDVGTLDPFGRLARGSLDAAFSLSGPRVAAAPDGTLWIQPLSFDGMTGAGLARLAEDGSILELHDEMILGDETVTIGDAAALRLSPDGRQLWLSTRNVSCADVLRLDVTGPIPVATAIDTGTDCLSAYIVEPLTPAGAAAPTAWAMRDRFGASPAIGLLTDAGFTPHSSGAIPATELQAAGFFAAHSNRTDDLCLVTGTPTYAVNMRWLSVDDTSDVYPGVLQLDPGRSVVAASLSPDGSDGEMCWVLVYRFNFLDTRIELHGFNRAGVEVRTWQGYANAGAPASLLTPDEDLAWMIVNSAEGTERVRIELGPVNVTTSSIPASSGTFLVPVESNAYDPSF